MAFDPCHYPLWVPTWVARKRDIPATTLNQRSHVRFAKFLFERNKIAFPMAKLASLGDDRWSLRDGVFGGDVQTSGPARIATTARLALPRQMPSETSLTPLQTIDELVNRLMAHRLPRARM